MYMIHCLEVYLSVTESLARYLFCCVPQKKNDIPEIGADRQKMEILIKDPSVDPVVLSLKYLEICTDNFTTKVLGEGAFGKIFFGCDKELGIRIAVKRINLQVPDQDTLDEITLSFKREIAVSYICQRQ